MLEQIHELLYLLVPIFLKQIPFQLLQIEKLDEHFAQHLDSLELKDIYMHLIIRRGIRYQQEWVAWCDEALLAIDQAIKR